MLYLPLTTNPLGWAILGLGGYVLYKTGKKKGEEEAAAAQITAIPAPAEAGETDKEEQGEK